MRIFGCQAAGLITIAGMLGCSSSDPLSGTSWSSATLTPDQATAGVISSTFIIMFGDVTTSMNGMSTGPFTAELTQLYGAAGTRPGCTEMTTFSGTMWSDDVTQPGVGTLSLAAGEVSTTTRTGCSNQTDDGTDSNTSLYTDTGGTEQFTVSGTALTMSGDSLVPFAGNTYTFAML